MLGSFLFTAMAATLPPPTLIVNRVASGYSLKLAEGAPFRTTSAQVTNRATFRLNDGSVIGFWKEDGVPRYLIAPDGRTVLREVEVDTKVSLKYATFDPLKSVPTIDETVATPNDNELCVVQFKTQPLSSYREAIEAAGGTWYDVVPTNSVICRIPASAREEVSKLNYVRWVGAYESAYKLAEIAMTPLRAGTLKTQEYDIWCNQRGIEMQQAVADRIESLGGRVIQLIPLGFRMTVELSPVQLKQVLGMNEIQFIDPHGPATQDMDIVRGYGGANFIETTLGFTGQGVRAEVMDGGLLQTHVAWGSAPLVHAPSLPVDSHGTATFGINFGNGTGNAAGRGMMPNAQGVMANYNAFNGGSRYTHTAQLLASPYFCVSQSNSWGNAQVTTYTAISAEMDDILYQNNIVILNSQSNTGNQTSRPQAWAKNIVSVGAFNHFNNTNDADDRWSGGASIGPAADGRVKPDIAYWYDNILCPTSSSTTAYTSGFGGTSAATPMTAGHFGLFFQMWHNGLFAVPVPAATVFDNRPKSTLAKAIMINTANQRTLPAPFDITRNVQGWGVVNLTSLYNARSKMLTVNETDVLTNLQTNSYKVQVAAGEPAFRATMCYLDPAGTVGAAQARKNNLSLRVTGPTGTIWRGNNGMATSNWTVAGGVENNVDTVENVYIQSPAAGIYTVEVIGSDINTDARVETSGTIDADYALVVTGITTGPTAPSAFALGTSPNFGGNLASLAISENNRLLVGSSFISSRNKFLADMDCTFTTTLPTLSKLEIVMERNGSFPGAVEKIQVLNPTTGIWTTVQTNTVPQTTDTVVTAVVPSPAPYISGGVVKVRCSYEKEDPTLNRTASINVDYIRIKAQP